jgi:hypothetical protein
VLDSQHTLHQIEVERGHTRQLAQPVADQRFFRRAIHVLDPVRHPLADRRRGNGSGWLLLQGRGWDHSRGFDRPRVAEGLLLGAHADRGQDLLHLRACLSEVFHRQGALSEVEVEVLNSLDCPEVRADEFLLARAVHVLDAVGGRHGGVSDSLSLHAHRIQRLLQGIGRDFAVRNGQQTLRKIEQEPLDTGHALQRSPHQCFLIAAIHVAHVENGGFSAGLLTGARRLLAIAAGVGAWAGRFFVHRSLFIDKVFPGCHH